MPEFALHYPFCNLSERGSREELTLEVLELNNRTQCHNAIEFPFSVTVPKYLALI